MTIALPASVQSAYSEANYERNYSFDGKNGYEIENESTFEVAGDDYDLYLCELFGVN